MCRRILFLVILTIVLVSCSTNKEEFVNYIHGYWEITMVKKNNAIIKEYSLNALVDYFELNDDLTGYRKKVAPTFDGTFNITKHVIPFKLKFENDSLNIYYTYNETATKETIIKASTTELIITNSEGFKYTYRPYKKFDVE